MAHFRIGIDTGGTFTDVVAVNTSTGAVVSTKTPSTPVDPADGFLAGIDKILNLIGATPAEVSAVLHGTTVATNTVLTGTGARCGLVTTVGYRQVLQIARSFVPGGLGGCCRAVSVRSASSRRPGTDRCWRSPGSPSRTGTATPISG